MDIIRHKLHGREDTSYCAWPGHEATYKRCHSYPPPHQLQLPYRLQHREYLTPLQATDPGGIITMVTASGRSFTRQIKTEDTEVQETNPATPGQLVLGK